MTDQLTTFCSHNSFKATQSFHTCGLMASPPVRLSEIHREASYDNASQAIEQVHFSPSSDDQYSITQVINIDSVTVRSDGFGRFCLNDLQKAATVGRNARSVEVHEYLRRPETQALIAEIENTGNSNIKAVETRRGRNGGTFVCHELVYAYAMWISPAFHLKVIRAFDLLNTRGVALAEHAVQDFQKNPLKYFRRMLEQAEQLKAKMDLAQSRITT